jgi:hypothetical protein
VFITNHTLAGGVIGLAARGPVAAFAAGAASHVAMDMVLHWGDDLTWEEFVQVARVDGVIGLAAAAALLAVSPRRSRVPVAAGIAGACLLDMDKPGRHFLGRSPFPPAVDRFHNHIQRERPVGALVEAASGLALAAAAAGAVAVVRSRRSV